MKYLTTEQAKKIYQDAKGRGLDPDEVMSEIVRRGTIIEGIDMDQARQFSQRNQPQPEQQPQQSQQYQPQEKKPGFLQEGGAVQQFGTGLAKSALSTIKGIGQIGERILPPAPAFGSVYSDEATKGGLLDSENLKGQTGTEKFGKFAGDVAQFAIPAGRIAKATQGASMAGRIIPRMISSGTVATLQEGEVGKGTATAAGAELLIPGISKALTPVKNIASRLFRNLGSGLSGANRQVLESIVQNPNIASSSKKELLTKGNSELLKKNTQVIMDGVSKIKSEARQIFGEGLEKLKAIDIDNKIFRNSTQNILDKFGSMTQGGKRVLSNIEFNDPKNIKTANELLNKLQKTKLDGKSLRKLISDIESNAYKIATSDERLSFNVFVKDLSGSLKNAISKSTSKLDDINKVFSKDMALAESIENIFGKVKYKNASELNKISQKIESLFSQKGLSPEYLDNFLSRIGIKPESFKTSEAVRQISNISEKANTKGFSFAELLQGLTSAIIPPERVRDIAIATGKSQIFIKNLLEKTAPSARSAVIRALIPKD